MDKRKNIIRPAFCLGLLFLLLLAAGCSQSPTEAPVSTVISGYDSLGVSKYDYLDTYYFKSGATNYGSFQLMWLAAGTPSIVQFISNYGIKMGTGTVAPDSGYFHDSTLENSPLGQSFFIKTDNVPHFGKITITSRRDHADTTFIGFQWVVQTVAGKRELY